MVANSPHATSDANRTTESGAEMLTRLLQTGQIADLIVTLESQHVINQRHTYKLKCMNAGQRAATHVQISLMGPLKPLAPVLPPGGVAFKELILAKGQHPKEVLLRFTTQEGSVIEERHIWGNPIRKGGMKLLQGSSFLIE